ncbi:hypothetical protein BJY04DRAFT_230959 [Aspergillus karnatakaensis]|uniref:oxygenase MpaB family protein n=1 Tax=Aspergillus karnatakaensis TaxID=1810916 RepID=UPI003CCD6101
MVSFILGPTLCAYLKKVAREGIALAGGPAAILLQIAHPSVGQGVADHSTFTKRAIARVQYTQMYIYVMIFGDDTDKAAMKAWVDQAHARVKSNGPRAYSALDPELQLWVAITIYASMVGMYELIYGPLPPAMAERVFQAYSVMGTSLQVPPEMWPKNLSEFRTYWRDMTENQLRVSADAELVMKEIFHPVGSVPFWAKPAVLVAMPFIRRLTIEQLPPAVREQFHLKSTKSSRAIAGLFVSGMTCVYPFTPLFVRQFPKTYAMRLFRKKVKKRGGQLVKA